MPTIKELRERARHSRETQEAKIARAQGIVQEVVQSDAFKFTVANHFENEGFDNKVVDDFAREVATEIISKATDPKLNFLDICQSRGMSKTKIREVVRILAKAFSLECDADYETQLEAVALYLEDNPRLYTDLAVLQ